jgi:hypothetical protein
VGLFVGVVSERVCLGVSVFVVVVGLLLEPEAGVLAGED